MEKREFVPSEMQKGFMDWVSTSKGSAVLIAVAGSGKSTTIKRCLPCIPEAAPVIVLAFNKTIADDMAAGIAELGKEIGRPFANVSARTFHSLGFGAVCKRLGKGPRDLTVDGRKLTKLFREGFPSHIVDLYKDFVPKLVSLAKGQGIGCLLPDTADSWFDIVEHHAIDLDSEDATVDEGIRLAQTLLDDSNKAALAGFIDYDDQLYLPVLWNLRLLKYAWVLVDEAQDTNPIRRALAKMILMPGGRLVAVGDPNQAIYGFTGASHDAIDLIKREFNAIELPLTVSYRCPKAAEPLVQPMVPHFSVHESAPEGAVLHLGERAGLARLSNTDAVICRNTAPLVELAFSLIAQDRACKVLGKDIGAGLIALVEQMRARTIDAMIKRLDAHCDKLVARFMAKGQEQQAESLMDRAACIRVIAERMPKGTLAELVGKLNTLFSDNGPEVLTLCTIHKAKGREWNRVAILQPELMPSKYARQDWQAQQEQNLIYVAITRFIEELIFLDDDNADQTQA